MSRLRPTDVAAGIGGAVLLGSLWLTWYGDLTAWRAFTVIDVLLALLALLALAVPVSSALARGPALPVAFTVLASAGGFLAVLLVLFRIADPPGSSSIEAGAWIGLAGAVLTLAGSWLAMADDSTPGAVPPQVPRRPAP